MENQTNKRDTQRELEKQAIEYLWDKNQYEDAIALVKRLFRYKPRYPLYYLILSDCYKGIAHHPHYIKAKLDLKASEKSQMYYDRAFAPDGKFVRSDYYEQGIDAAAHYLLETQDLEELTALETKRVQELSKKKVTPGELYQAILGQDSVSKDPAVRLAYLKKALSLAKAGFNQNLYAFDSDGNSVNPTLQELKKAKLKDPKRQIIFVISYKDPITGKETQHTFNILKNFNLDSPSESVIKARLRRSRYYYSRNHQQERKEYQKLYDSKNRQRKRVRNKLDYSWRQSGLTKKYYTEDKSSEE